MPCINVMTIVKPGKSRCNATKTKIITFNKGGHRISKFSFKMEDKDIEIVLITAIWV